MAFHNVPFPVGVEYGSRFGAGFSTIIQESASGHELRLGRQSQPRHQFRLVKVLQSRQQAADLKAFAIARRGSLHSFPLKDEQDFTTAADGVSAPTATDQFLGSGDGTNARFALLKLYGSGGPGAYARRLRLPVTGTVLIAVDGTPTTAFTVGDGEVLLTTPPTAGQAVTGGCQFNVPARFGRGIDTWAALQADAYDRWSFPDLDAIEVLDEEAWPEVWYGGGSYSHGDRSSDVLLKFRDGKFQIVRATAPISAFLPSPYLVPGGDTLLSLMVDITSPFNVTLRTDDGTSMGVLTPGRIYRMTLATFGGLSYWVAS